MTMNFYQCKICGKIIQVLSDTEIPTMCCGQNMRPLIPNQTDGAADKHVPVITRKGDMVLVQIGSAPHPMEALHSITWIGLSTDRGFQYRELRPGDDPEASFFLPAEEGIHAAYAYCNLHGLWSKEEV